MQKLWKLAVGTLLTTSLVLTGCGAKEDAAPSQSGDGNKLKVVTTFYPMYEFSKQVAGEYADVSVLVPAGTEPHDWEPSPKDVAEISKSNVFVYNGAGFEAWVDQVLDSMQESKTTVVEASKGLQLMEGSAEHAHDEHGAEEHSAEEHQDGEHAMDPHVWLDPVLVQQEVKNIADAMAKADPSHADAYQKNADAYIEKLKGLDDQFQKGLQNVKAKEVVTAHTAFAYLAKRYGLEQLPIAGLSPDLEPSAGEMKEIVTFAKEHNVKTIFFETLASPKVAETVANEIGAKTDVLNPLEGLTEEEQKQGLDYLAVMKKNLEALQNALNS